MRRASSVRVKIARKLYEDVAFRVLSAGNFPAHRTICDFRSLHLKELAALFVQVVHLASECGLVTLGTIAIDGTKIKANASRHKAMSYKFMLRAEAELKAEIEALLERARAVDEAERDQPDLDLPAELKRRKDRLAAISAAKARREERQREMDKARGRSQGDERKPRHPNGDPKGGLYARDFGVPEETAQENFTDCDSRIMKRSGGGFDPAFNAHAAVDETAQIVVAAELTNNASDSDRLQSSSREPQKWRPPYEAMMGRRPIENASGSLRLRTVGSRMSWASDNSASEAWPRWPRSGSLSVRH